MDDDLEKLKDELTSMKNTYSRNKAESIQMEAELKKIAKSVDSVNKAIGKARKITETWSEEDRYVSQERKRSLITNVKHGIEVSRTDTPLFCSSGY